jgi:hypothetical protein
MLGLIWGAFTWLRIRLYWRFFPRRKRVSRPVTGHEVRTSLQTMANENPTLESSPYPRRVIEARLRDF